MNRPYPPEIQRRLRALYRYVRAMEAGDLASLASLLREAEQDAALDRMFQEVDLHYLDQAQFLPPGEVAAAEQRVARLFVQETGDEQAQKHSVRIPIQPAEQRFPLQPERRPIPMHYPPDSWVQEQDTLMMPALNPVPKKPRQKRSSRLLQLLAATLAIIVLLGGSLLLYTRFNPRQPGQGTVSTAATQTSVPLVGITSAVKMVLVNGKSRVTTTYAIHALRPRSSTPIWSTTLIESDNTASPNMPLLVQGQMIYTAVGNTVFALNAESGQIIWEKALPLVTTLQVNGDLLIAGSASKAANNGIGTTSSIYRLNEQSGTLLWQHQTFSGEPVFAVGDGVVYLGLYQAHASSTPGCYCSLAALRGSDGSMIWSQKMPSLDGLAVLNGTIYVEGSARGANGLANFSLSAWSSSGTRLWSNSLASAVANGVSGPGISIGSGLIDVLGDSGLVLVALQDESRDLCAYHVENGQKAWCNPPVQNATYLYYHEQNGVLYAVYVLSPIMAGSGQDNPYYIQAFNLQTGVSIWSHPAGTTTVVQNGIKKEVSIGSDYTNPQALLATADTLLIAPGTTIFTFSLSRGQFLGQINITIPGSTANLASRGFINLANG